MPLPLRAFCKPPRRRSDAYPLNPPGCRCRSQYSSRSAVRQLLQYAAQAPSLRITSSLTRKVINSPVTCAIPVLRIPRAGVLLLIPVQDLRRTVPGAIVNKNDFTFRKRLHRQAFDSFFRYFSALYTGSIHRYLSRRRYNAFICIAHIRSFPSP